MEIFLGALLSYLISLAANERTAAIHKHREKELAEQLEKENAIRSALASRRSIRDEVRTACVQQARNRAQFEISPKEEPIWRMLLDELFQNDIAEWLMAGGIEEGNAVKDRLLRSMEVALADGGATAEQIAFLKTGYFEALEHAVFSNPILAHWRHQLSLDYLREQVAMLRRRAEEAAGIYSPERQKIVLNGYCEKALTAYDIIDLSNLPEGDIHIATQRLLLRQLYLPLRLAVESKDRRGGQNAGLARLEEEREGRRLWEAGRFKAGKPDRPSLDKRRVAIGKQLDVARRLVVLGDPGGGKTTMLRWMATAYLLRHRQDPSFGQLPDTETLPEQQWIPVLIRCRDLGEADLCRSFTDFLAQHLRKTELLPEEADVMRALILDRIAKGQALLLVDGLDEISNPLVRVMFCQELERTAARYPEAPIIVASRIVGYRDMPYRMGPSFEHSVIAELSRKDKDLFAQRWVEITEQHLPAAEKALRAQELLDALHSSDRIERLAGNPMLLTTLALVKRKVGKLPNRRTKLYAEAVSVLLNWNPRLYTTIEEDEAIPQLEYLGYEMCRRGVQQLTEDEVLDLLDKVRVEYPNVRAIRRRDPHDFLHLLEARSSILIRSGGIWQKERAQEKPVWEFRHLTFQEYLAARAILDGRYPGRDKTMTIAEQVAPLAGTFRAARRYRATEGESEVAESWKETLRLLVADCKDDDVDDVLLAILNPAAGESFSKTARPRAVLAALCLADEPNVSEETAQRVLANFSQGVDERDGTGGEETTLTSAALEVAASMWAPFLKRKLMEEYSRRPPESRWNVGSTWGMTAVAIWRRSGVRLEVFFDELVHRLQSRERTEALSAALTVMGAAYRGEAVLVPGLVPALFSLFGTGCAESHAAAWALAFIGKISIWRPNTGEVETLSGVLAGIPEPEIQTRRWIVGSLANSKNQRSVEPLIRLLEDSNPHVRGDVVEALGKLGDKQAVEPLILRLVDPSANVRRAVADALRELGDKRAVKSLIRLLEDPDTGARHAVVVALRELRDKQAVEPLIQRLEDPSANVRRAVADALGELGDKQAVEPLIRRLEDSDTGVIRAVADALRKLGDKQAVELLIRRLEDPNADVRRTIANALRELGDKQAIEPLIRRLEDPNARVRRVVAAALGQLKDKQAIEPLIRLLEDPDSGVRRAIANALRELGDKQVVEPLIRRLEDPDTGVRRAIASALGQLKDEQAVEPLIRRLEDPDTGVRRAIAAALGQLKDKQAVDPLIRRLEDPDTGVRRAIAGALGQLKDKQAVDPLIRLLEDPDTGVRRAIATALGQLKDKQAVDPLIRLLDDQEDVCLSAAIALAALDHPQGHGTLREFFNHESQEKRLFVVSELARVRNKTDRILLSRDLDGAGPWIDPRDTITKARVEAAAQKLNMSVEEMHSRYQVLSTDFHLRLESRT